MNQMGKQGTSTHQVEQEILTEGCKLRAVMEENQKFDEVIQGLLLGYCQSPL